MGHKETEAHRSRRTNIRTKLWESFSDCWDTVPCCPLSQSQHSQGTALVTKEAVLKTKISATLRKNPGFGNRTTWVKMSEVTDEIKLGELLKFSRDKIFLHQYMKVTTSVGNFSLKSKR